MKRLRILIPLLLIVSLFLTFTFSSTASANSYAPCGGTLVSSVNFDSSNNATYNVSGPTASTTVRIEKYNCSSPIGGEYAVVRSYWPGGQPSTSLSVGIQNSGASSYDYNTNASYTNIGYAAPGYTNLACGGANLNSTTGNGGCTAS